MTGVYVVLGVLVLTGALALLARTRRGLLRDTRGRRADGTAVDVADFGARAGERATLLQFSSAFCAPCRATRRILAEVAGMVEGVAHVEIDAESHLDAVNRLHIRRTPTVLVLDGAGRVVTRASGAPRKADVIAALGRVPAGR